MAYETESQNITLQGLAASNINAGAAVALVGAVTAGSAADEKYQTATVAKQIAGVARATALAGRAVDVHMFGVVKCLAAASIGAGAPVGPVSGGSTALGIVASGSQKVGWSLVNAAAGDLFSVRLEPGVFIL
jgi:hypothetical protein